MFVVGKPYPYQGGFVILGKKYMRLKIHQQITQIFMICGSFSEPVPKYVWIVCTVCIQQIQLYTYKAYKGEGVVEFSTSTLCV